MTLNTSTREQQRLREIAREYRQRGYDVIIEPRADQLPGFLAPFRIDMLARSAEETVIVEVRTQESLSDTPELDAVAQALQDHASWRFELVVTNPKDRSSLQFKDASNAACTRQLATFAEERRDPMRSSPHSYVFIPQLIQQGGGLGLR
jgi:hypothetical protein